MKIDFIIGSLRSGGAERVVCNLANYFASKGDTVRIITFIEGDKYTLHENIQRIRFHKNLPVVNYALTRAVFSLSKFYRSKNNRPHVISSHIHLMGIATIPISKLYGIKLVVSEHFNHAAAKVTFQKWILWNFLYKFPNAVTILTSFDKPFFEKKNDNVVVMHNPSSFEPFLKRQHNSTKSIVAIGSLDRYIHKGFDNLLSIASEIKKKNSDWKIMIVGEGNDGYNFLNSKIIKLKLEKFVTLTGFRSDIQNIMRENEIFILTSRHEGLPMVLIEAASQGMACIAYDCVSGPSEIIKDGENGFLVEDQNKEAMVERTLELMENSTLRRQLGSNATHSSKKFSMSNIGAQWEALFASII